MTIEDVLEKLRSAGTAQNRKVYGKHGVGGDMFGVSYANLGALKKKIGTNQALAEALWATGNHDARVLATMVADAGAMNKRQIDGWAKDLDNYVITDAFSKLASRALFAKEKMEKWSRSRDEWVCSAAWTVLAHLAMDDERVPDEFLNRQLKTIEDKIHDQKNRVRHAMNMALISIGIRNGKLEKAALAAAGRIGRVTVDHGETSCRTPDATGYIQQTIQRKRNRKKPG
jgi:3-methyladenine DNA glycosylase AlkD